MSVLLALLRTTGDSKRRLPSPSKATRRPTGTGPMSDPEYVEYWRFRVEELKQAGTPNPYATGHQIAQKHFRKVAEVRNAIPRALAAGDRRAAQLLRVEAARLKAQLAPDVSDRELRQVSTAWRKGR